MKKILMILGITALAFTAEAQVNNYNNGVVNTQIQTPPNATFQNNSQFYNKDNNTIQNRVVTNSNGTYWTPGYSNDANRQTLSNGLAPNGSVNSSTNSSGNNYYNRTINVNDPNTSMNNINRITPSNVNPNVYRP